MKEIHATRQEYEKICEYCRKNGYMESNNQIKGLNKKPIYWYHKNLDNIVYREPFRRLELRAGGLEPNGQRLAINANLTYRIHRHANNDDYYAGDVIVINKNIVTLEDFQLLENKIERITELAKEFNI